MTTPTSGLQNLLGYGAGDDNAAAQDALERASKQFNIPLPQLKELALKNPNWEKDLQASTVAAPADVQYKGAATNDAALTQAGPSAWDQVSTDPRLKDQQMASLGALKQLSDKGGMNATDQANLSRIQDSAAQADAGRRGAIMESQDRRGMGGSGMDLMAQLASSQAATQQQSQQGLDVAGQAQARALQAMQAGGSLAGNIRNQDFGEQGQVASARDAINKFNSSNANQMAQYNASQGNEQNRFNAGNTLGAQEFNSGTNLGAAKFNAGQTQAANQFNTTGAQAVSDAGVANQNSASRYNAGLPQQQFDNQYKEAAGKSGVAGQLSNYFQNQAKQKTDQFGNLVSGAAQVGAAAATGGGSIAAQAAVNAATPKPTAETRAAKENSGDMSDTGAYAFGGMIPGHAKVPGDSPANDTVAARLSPGEVVLPRSVVAKAGKSNDLDRVLASLKSTDGAKDDKIPDLHGAMMAALKHLSKKG